MDTAVMLVGLLVGCGGAVMWILRRVRMREIEGEIEARLAHYGGRRI